LTLASHRQLGLDYYALLHVTVSISNASKNIDVNKLQMKPMTNSQAGMIKINAVLEN